MNKEEIRRFKSLLRQGILRHKSVLLDDKFQSELLNIIKNYEHLEQQCKKQKDNWNKLKEYLHNVDVVIDYSENYDGRFINYDELVNKMQELEKGSDE